MNQLPLSPRHLYYGGTFDPVHNGHLKPSIALAETLEAERLSFMPCFIPPHKEPARVTSHHRLQMLHLALEAEQANTRVKLDIEEFELNRQAPSYTVTTLEHFTERLTTTESAGLGLVIGMDSLLSLTKWHRWQDILALSHIYVMARPGYVLIENELPAELEPYLQDRIKLVPTPELDISSTHIRHQLLTGQSVEADSLPESVLDYIEQHQLYRAPRL